MAFEEARTLADIVTLVRGTTYKSALLGQSGPVLLGLASIQRNGGFRSDSLKTYGGESKEKLLLRPGDLFVSLKDVTQSADLLGAIARVPTEVELGRLTQDTVKLEFRDNSYPRALLYWALRSPDFRAYCRAHATGTTNLGLPREDFLAYELPAATPEVLSLVQLLESIEERITFLGRINTTLEDIAQALFKSWFVDFDPVRVKTEGREPEGMDADTAALFPSEFEGSELGPIPKGWRTGMLADVSSLNASKWTARKHPPTVRYIDLSGVHSNRIDQPMEFSFDEAPSRARQHLREGDTIIGTVRPGNRAFAYIHEPDANLTGSTGFAVLSPKAPHLSSFVYLAATRDDAIDRLANLADGGAYPAVRPSVVADTPCVIPHDDVFTAFAGITTPLLVRIAQNSFVARTLADLRDTLLPRLISGKLRLPDAQELLEEVAS